MSDTLTHPSRRVPWLTIALVAAGLLVAACLDLPVKRWVDAHVHTNTETKDWAKMLRSGGYLPTWIIVSLGLLLVDVAAFGRWSWVAARRTIILIGGIVLSGICVEIAKLIFRRLRPDVTNVWYAFRPFNVKPFDNGGLSLPSSHGAIAFGAAFALVELFPSAKYLWISVAIGTGLTRVLADAHYCSDIYAAAIFGAILARLTRMGVDRLIPPPADAMRG